MRFTLSFVIAVAAIAAPAVAEVPQEHSHEKQLKDMQSLVPGGTPSVRQGEDNLSEGNLPDAVFGLLANAAANDNAPKGDGVCLQQDIADTGISLANGDANKIAIALKYRALERNSGKVGGLSDLCTKPPINDILVGLQQHQDPASQGALATNKEVEITLAQKLASLGIDPLEALETATFPPGDVNDQTAKGLSCNDLNDANGCIFTLNLDRPAATEEEITNCAESGEQAGEQANEQQNTEQQIGEQ